MKNDQEESFLHPMRKYNDEDFLVENKEKTYMNKLNILNMTRESNKFIIDRL